MVPHYLVFGAKTFNFLRFSESFEVVHSTL